MHKSNIEQIIELNKKREQAIVEKRYDVFAKCSLRLHKLEISDKVDINSYCILHSPFRKIM